MQTNRLTTIDEYGQRRFVIPAEVTGPFRTWRNKVNFVLIFVFLLLPWLKVNGLQAVLLDIPHRRFEIFGKLFLAHDAPLVFLIFAIAAMALAFVTAVWGRVWCGWACPQTVFIDGLYRKIEILIEGNYLARRRLQREELSWNKFWRMGAKWGLYLILSSVIAHSFLAYFTGSARLIEMIQGSPRENWTYFLLVSSVTALLLFNFGWFREQFCTIMCPYGRFQSVLMDEHTLNVLYDEKRGEPRKRKDDSPQKRGDCVSCNRCVEVCPANIDIREGIQMECIGCTACIDACNVIMKRVGKPADLIRYASVSGAAFKLWRLRTVAYAAIIVLCAGILGYSFLVHEPLVATVLRGRDIPFQTLPDGRILNHMKAHLFNQSQTAQEVFIELRPEDEKRGIQLTQVKASTSLPPGQAAEVHFFVTFPPSILQGRGESAILFNVRDAAGGVNQIKESMVVGPR